MINDDKCAPKKNFFFTKFDLKKIHTHTHTRKIFVIIGLITGSAFFYGFFLLLVSSDSFVITYHGAYLNKQQTELFINSTGCVLNLHIIIIIINVVVVSIDNQQSNSQPFFDLDISYDDYFFRFCLRFGFSPSPKSKSNTIRFSSFFTIIIIILIIFDDSLIIDRSIDWTVALGLFVLFVQNLYWWCISVSISLCVCVCVFGEWKLFFDDTHTHTNRFHTMKNNS